MSVSQATDTNPNKLLTSIYKKEQQIITSTVIKLNKTYIKY